MIPGLNVDPETESRIWAVFARWADHFRASLKSGGIEYLLSEYEELVFSVETESCDHGSFGRHRAGEDWQTCCGISYEYINDISVHDAIEVILSLASNHMTDELKTKIASLDERLYALYEHCPERHGAWWHQGLPRGIIE